MPADGKIVPMVSDFFDFSIYIDADENQIHNWYVERFMRLRQTAFRDPSSFFNRYATITEEAALAIAEGLWQNINLKNLQQNILPTRPRGRSRAAQRQQSFHRNGRAAQTVGDRSPALDMYRQRLTRRSVRLTLPPCFKSVDVPG